MATSQHRNAFNLPMTSAIPPLVIFGAHYHHHALALALALALAAIPSIVAIHPGTTSSAGALFLFPTPPHSDELERWSPPPPS